MKIVIIYDDAITRLGSQFYSYSLQIFNAARQLSHIEAAPEKFGLVLPWPWLQTVCTHNSCVHYLAWSNDMHKGQGL